MRRHFINPWGINNVSLRGLFVPIQFNECDRQSNSPLSPNTDGRTRTAHLYLLTTAEGHSDVSTYINCWLSVTDLPHSIGWH